MRTDAPEAPRVGAKSLHLSAVFGDPLGLVNTHALGAFEASQNLLGLRAKFRRNDGSDGPTDHFRGRVAIQLARVVG
jgi:hypothetical protein